jgi:hypothetical protein
MKQLETAPRYLREMLVFPYLRGQEFCAALFARGGYEAVSAPTRTRPVPPPRFCIRKNTSPTRGRIPSPSSGPALKVKGEKPIADNTVGEMGIRILFTEWLDAPTGEQASGGWRGDRYLYFAGGEGAPLEKRLGECAKDASEFFDAEKKLLEKRYHPPNPRSTGRSYEADAPCILRLRQTDANEVILIDAAQAEWAEALARFH